MMCEIIKFQLDIILAYVNTIDEFIEHAHEMEDVFDNDEVIFDYVHSHFDKDGNKIINRKKERK
jgi:hypothetical protein